MVNKPKRVPHWALPPVVTFPQAFDLTTVALCWLVESVSIQTIGVCFIWLQLLCLVINKHVPLLTVKVLFGICQPFILLLVFNMGSLVCCTGWVVNVLHTWLTVKVLCGIYQSFVLLLVVDMMSTLCCAGWTANVWCTCSHVICKHAPLLTVKALFGIH